jgi:hypothetical protein
LVDSFECVKMHGPTNPKCPVSSETDGIKESMVYLQSDAKELLGNNFLLHQYTASSVSGGL